MTQALPPSGGGSIERGGSALIRNESGEENLQTLHRRIFLEALNLVSNISSDNPFELVFVERWGSNIVMRAVEELAGTMLLPDKQIHFQSPGVIGERIRREAEIRGFIDRYSYDRDFSHGFHLMKEFVKGLTPYLDGSDAEPRADDGNMDDLMTIGLTKVPVKEVIQRRANDSRGYTLVQLASEILKNEYNPNIPADDKKRAGVKFFTELFKQALVESIQAGNDYPMLKILANFHPGDRSTTSDSQDT